MEINKKELASGLVCVGIGLYFCLTAWFALPMGTSRAMGPGYFPAMAGVLLVVIGLLVGVAGVRAPLSAFGPVPWRGLLMISLVPIIFGYLARGLGFLPTLIVCCGVAAFASTRMTLRYAAVLTVGLVILCWFIFVYLLELPIPLIGRWLTQFGG
jgi:hypothetical protein